MLICSAGVCKNNNVYSHQYPAYRWELLQILCIPPFHSSTIPWIHAALHCTLSVEREFPELISTAVYYNFQFLHLHCCLPLLYRVYAHIDETPQKKYLIALILISVYCYPNANKLITTF